MRGIAGGVGERGCSVQGAELTRPLRVVPLIAGGICSGSVKSWLTEGVVGMLAMVVAYNLAG